MRIAVPVRLLALCALMTLTAGPAAAADLGSGIGSTAAVWDASTWTADALGDIDPAVFAAALSAAETAIAQGKAGDPSTLTVIDFTRPSVEKRMWVYDLRSRTLLFDELVSHGRGSGLTMATAFSNDADSHMSSLGLYRTGEAYMGKNGYSLRLDGLDQGVNDHARDRAIVVHGAPYVNAIMAKANGYLGRSYGCPAVRPEIARPLIDAIKGGGLLFAYGSLQK
jgi:L,D-transpeptidase catalytic domain